MKSKKKYSWFITTALIISGSVIAFSFFAPYFLVQPAKSLNLNFTDTGQIGDTLGGIMNPFIAIGAAILTFLAFFIQYQANRDVQKQFNVQQFESQFYEMIRLHRANLDEMDIANKIKGRKCFVRMFNEFKFIYLKLFYVYNNNETYKRMLSKEDLCHITYNIFFFGVSGNTNGIVFKLLPEKYHHITKKLIDNLEPFHQDYNNKIKQELFVNNEDGSNYKFNPICRPFDGHNTRLGHYYRHLFQTVSFVVDSDVIKDRKEKQKYLKLLRAQLSNHEQLLLYYNSLTEFGNQWIKRKYFTNFKMIKNIPLKLADFGVKPHDKLGKFNDYNETIFEWDELSSDNKNEIKHMETNEDNTLSLRERYELLIKARNFHYENFNKWMTYFYVMIAALVVGLCNILAKQPSTTNQLSNTENTNIVIGICLLGFIISMFWHWANKGYYYWNINFITLVNYYEKDLLKFKKTERIYCVFANKAEQNNYFNPIMGANLSTSKISLLLSYIITLFWGFLFFIFSFKNTFDYYVILALIAPTLIILVFSVLAKTFLYSNHTHFPDLELKNQSE